MHSGIPAANAPFRIPHSAFRTPLPRREMLRLSGLGFGSLALQYLLAREGHAAAGRQAVGLAPRAPHFEPRARLKPLVGSDLWNGRRQLFVAVTYGDSDNLASAGVECVATRDGIEVGMAMP